MILEQLGFFFFLTFKLYAYLIQHMNMTLVNSRILSK